MACDDGKGNYGPTVSGEKYTRTSNPLCGFPAGDCVLADELMAPLRAEIERLTAELAMTHEERDNYRTGVFNLKAERDRLRAELERAQRCVELSARSEHALEAERARLRAALERCHKAMCNYFSSDFDRGAQFSELTCDIPKLLAGAAPTTEQRLTKRQAAIIGAYTGVLCGPFDDLHEYVNSLPGFDGIGVLSFSLEVVAEAIKKASKEDFMRICSE